MAHDEQAQFDFRRRRILSALAAGLAGVALPHSAGAQLQNPKNTLRIVYPFSPGGAWDSLIRIIANRMGQSLRMPAIVESKPGGSGRVGLNYLRTLDPNGYNLIFTPIAQMVFAPVVQPHGDYDVQRDFSPIARVATYDSGCAVNPSLGIGSLADLVSWVKKNPGKANCGLVGGGGLHHFVAVALQKALNVDFQYVFYKGGGQLRGDLMAGHVPITFGTASEMTALHKAGKVRVIATSGTQRLLADVPTFREQGHDLVVHGWYSLYAQAKAPAPLLKTLEAASLSAMEDPTIRQTIVKMGAMPAALGAAGMRQVHKTDIERWWPIIKASGFKLER